MITSDMKTTILIESILKELAILKQEIAELNQEIVDLKGEKS